MVDGSAVAGPRDERESCSAALARRVRSKKYQAVAITFGSNISSLSTQRSLARTGRELLTVSERLSSGQRINRASDDAAGLAIAKDLDLRKLVAEQGKRNVGDANSALSIADGSLQELTNITIRQAEIAQQASNGVYGGRQRIALEREANALVNEFNRIVDTTSFNGIQLLNPSSSSISIQHGFGSSESTAIAIGSELGPAAGDGTFTQNANYSMSGAASLTLGDLNGDGNLDLVSSNANFVMSRLGNGDGTFGSATSIAGLGLAIAPALGDFNNDGRLDLVSPDQSSGQIQLNLGNGDGSFAAATSFSTGTGGLATMSSGDVNGDGNLDVVLSTGTAGAALLLGRGNGTFGTAISMSYGGALGDMNHDGILDLVDARAGTTYTQLGRGDGTFGTARTSSNPLLAAALPTLRDINGDGNIDVIASVFDKLTVATGNGDGTVQNAVQVALNGGGADNNPGVVVVADFNGDRYLDLAVNTNNAGPEVHLNNGDGTFRSGISSSLGLSDTAQSFVAGDLNADGLIDVVAGFNTGGANSAYVGLGKADASGRRNPFEYAFDFSTQASTRSAIGAIASYRLRIARERGVIGAGQSRLGTVTGNLDTTIENTAAAASRILDADLADESAHFAKLRILQQAGSAVLAQANEQPRIALSLLAP